MTPIASESTWPSAPDTSFPPLMTDSTIRAPCVSYCGVIRGGKLVALIVELHTTTTTVPLTPHGGVSKTCLCLFPPGTSFAKLRAQGWSGGAGCFSPSAWSCVIKSTTQLLAVCVCVVLCVCVCWVHGWVGGWLYVCVCNPVSRKFVTLSRISIY